MPIYIYEHPKTKQRAFVLQKMNDTHKFFKDGIEWRRVFEAPQATISAADKLNPFDSRAFVEKTKQMNVTQGDLWDISKTLSDQRAKSRSGIDPVKQRTVVDYERKCGVSHPLKSKD